MSDLPELDLTVDDRAITDEDRVEMLQRIFMPIEWVTSEEFRARYDETAHA